MSTLFSYTICIITFIISVSAFGFNYDCKQIAGHYYPSEVKKIKLTVTSETLKVLDLRDNYEFTGTIDNSYRPTPANRDYVRFLGESTHPAEGLVRFLIQKGLIAGEEKGYIEEQVEAEGGFFNYKYFCRISD